MKMFGSYFMYAFDEKGEGENGIRNERRNGERKVGRKRGKWRVVQITWRTVSVEERQRLRRRTEW